MDTINIKLCVKYRWTSLVQRIYFFSFMHSRNVSLKRWTPPWTASTSLPLASLTTRVLSSLYRIFGRLRPLGISSVALNVHELPVSRATCPAHNYLSWLLAVVDHVVASRLLPESCVRFPDTWCAPPCVMRPRASSGPAVYTHWPPLIFMLDLRFLMMFILVICSCSPS